MRARWLGSAGLTALVGCICGARLYLTGAKWGRRGFTVCDGCGAVIRYGTLRIVESHEAEEFFTMVIKEAEEREALRGDVERELRRFVRVFDGQPEWLWSPATVRFVRAVRPKLELLGGPVGEGRAEDVGTPEAAYRGREGEALLDEEALDDEWLDDESEPDAA